MAESDRDPGREYALLNDSQDLIHKRDPIENERFPERRGQSLGRLSLVRQRSALESMARASAQQKQLEVITEPELVETEPGFYDLIIPEEPSTEPEVITLGPEDVIQELEALEHGEDPRTWFSDIVDMSELTISPEPFHRCHVYGCLGGVANPDIALLCPEHFTRGIKEGWGSSDLFPPDGWLPPDPPKGR